VLAGDEDVVDVCEEVVEGDSLLLAGRKVEDVVGGMIEVVKVKLEINGIEVDRAWAETEEVDTEAMDVEILGSAKEAVFCSVKNGIV
jgi:hypothetical protein